MPDAVYQPATADEAARRAQPASLSRWQKAAAVPIVGLFAVFVVEAALWLWHDPAKGRTVLGVLPDGNVLLVRGTFDGRTRLRAIESTLGTELTRYPDYNVAQTADAIERIEPLDRHTLLILGRRGWCLHDPRDAWIDLDRSYPDAAYLSPEQRADFAAEPKLVNHYLSRKAKARLNASARTVRIQEVDRLRLCCPKWAGQTLRVGFERDFDLADYSGAPLAIDQPRKGTLVFEFEPWSDKATDGSSHELNPHGIDATQPPAVSVEFDEREKRSR